MGRWCNDDYVAINGNTVAAQGLDPSLYVFVKPINGWADMTETDAKRSAEEPFWFFGSPHQ